MIAEAVTTLAVLLLAVGAGVVRLAVADRSTPPWPRPTPFDPFPVPPWPGPKHTTHTPMAATHGRHQH